MSNSTEGSICLDDRSSHDHYYLSYDGENNGMDVDDEGGSYAYFGHASSIELDEMIEYYVFR